MIILAVLPPHISQSTYSDKCPTACLVASATYNLSAFFEVLFFEYYAEVHFQVESIDTSLMNITVKLINVMTGPTNQSSDQH